MKDNRKEEKVNKIFNHEALQNLSVIKQHSESTFKSEPIIFVINCKKLENTPSVLKLQHFCFFLS